MDSVIPIIVTGGGAPGISGTLYALRNNPDGEQFRIITTDIRSDVPGRYLADTFHTLPAPESGDYLPALADIVRSEHAAVILPQTTREIEVLSGAHDFMKDAGASIVVSPRESIRRANDKYELLNYAREAGVPCPGYVLTHSRGTLETAARSFGYPEKNVVVKPRVSNGMRGLRIITETPWTSNDFLTRKPEGAEMTMENLFRILENGEWPELIVTSYLPGDEYTVDVFRGANGTLAIPRRRDIIRSGISFETTVVLRDDIAVFSKTLAETLDLRFCFGFQFKLDADGVPKLLESNPRVQGTMVASVFAGFNMVYFAVKEALGRPVPLENVTLKGGVSFKRCWGGLASHDNERIGSF